MESVGSMIRHWRKQRRMSQLLLAEAAEVSTRHLSFLETGRAHPSRQMVLVLGSAMDMPLRERNTMLQAAGYTPAYRESDLDSDELSAVREALSFMLRAAEPNGVLVMNKRWDLLMANEPFQRMSTLVLGRPLRPGDNMIALTLRPDGLRPVLREWDALARGLLLRVHREAVANGDHELFGLLDELEAIDGMPTDWRRDVWVEAPVAMTLTFDLLGAPVRLFTTLTTMGTPTDVTLSELRIEHYFPADEASRDRLTALMALPLQQGPATADRA